MDLSTLFLLVITGLISATTTSSLPDPTPFSLPGCPDQCGNLRIPYPFGTDEGCYREEKFRVHCDKATGNATVASVDGDVQVLNIYLEDHQLTVSSGFAKDCNISNSTTLLTFDSFFVSSSRNKLVAVGCASLGLVMNNSDDSANISATGCFSICSDISSVVNGSCNGIGCCQSPVPHGMRGFVTEVDSVEALSNVTACNYAFVIEDGAYNFSSLDLSYPLHPWGLNTIQQFPVVFDWAVGNETCAMAKNSQQTYACKSTNSSCSDSDDGLGYRCYCPEGYHGNPYIGNGCQDIDECSDPKLNQCLGPQHCKNTPGNYTCFCPKGSHGDGKREGQGCQSSKEIVIGVTVGLVVTTTFVVVCFALWGIQRRKKENQRKELFKENGGQILLQLLSKNEDPGSKARLFTEEELRKATNGFAKSEIIGEGGYGTVYRGTLGSKLVAIKKSKVIDRAQTEQFVNEITVLAKINHQNAVKLVGCCLETPVPLLVYEFIPNKTLHYHLHDRGHTFPMPWKTRLRIAAEAAGALAHMHSDCPIHIIHRDVKSANILLDDNFTAKVSDFGVSRLVPLDQTQLSTVVQGTVGYLDPEYFHSGLLTDKSDVYSFGVVLLELLTGQKVLAPGRPDKDKSLVKFFTSAMKEDRLLQILDASVKIEENREQQERVAELAMQCLRLNPEKRPRMKEVKRTLDELLSDYQCSDAAHLVNSEESEPLLVAPGDLDNSDPSSGLDSLTNQSILQLTNLASGR